MSSISWLSEANNKQIALFQRYLWEVYIKGSNFSLKEACEKFTVDITMVYPSPSQVFNTSGELISLPLPKQINSFVALLDPRKCITLFNDFDDYYQKLKLSPIQIELQFQHNNITFWKYHEDDFYISLHSPNVLPDFKRENIFQNVEDEHGQLHYLLRITDETTSSPFWNKLHGLWNQEIIIARDNLHKMNVIRNGSFTQSMITLAITLIIQAILTCATESDISNFLKEKILENVEFRARLDLVHFKLNQPNLLLSHLQSKDCLVVKIKSLEFLFALKNNVLPRIIWFIVTINSKLLNIFILL